ncbi:HEPN domain-containing protein [Rhizobium multihospitium]|uniref:RiboL-PSP-HEPN domain-containing protein n=1 Tax=Rhizobium multihospitium TaxID=410764 RepID=A0A1C3X2P7_9HYPH|nr:HEPN domain-containing protein [Rhizobium multihospitium]SCB46523.1 hypothetical protein GA0061103_6968 [Rhizobium multihospitium]
MQTALDQFYANITRVKALVGLHNSLKKQTTAALDVSDLLRACHVMCVSAVDHYIHEVARIGMMETFDGLRAPTPAFNRFRLGMSCIVFATSPTVSRSNIESDIREQHSYLSFQQPDKIADAIRLVTESKLWEQVAALVSSDAKSVKDRITLIVDRRNKIAHEADLDPTYPNSRWPIDTTDLEATISFVEDIILAIHLIVEL